MALFKENSKLPFLFLCAVILIGLITIYSFSVKNYFQQKTYYVVEEAAKNSAESIDAMINYASTNIQLAALITGQAAIPEILNSHKVIWDSNDYQEKKSPFKTFTYIHNDPDCNEDFHEKPYYKAGIQGKNGIYLELNPETNLIEMIFYTPVYTNEKIAGVLFGSLSGTENILSYLKANFFDQEMVSILVNENYKVIISNNDEVPAGILLTDYEKDEFVKSVIRMSEHNDNSAFKFVSKGKTNAASVSKLDSGWSVIQIVPADSFEAIMHSVSKRTIALIVFILITVTIYIAQLIIQNERNLKQSEKSNISVINALASSYENVYLVNLKTGFLRIYHLSKDISKAYGTSFAQHKYDESFKVYEENEVYEADRTTFETISTLDKVKKIFEKNKEYSFVYRVKRNDAILYFECQMIKPFESNPEFVIAFKNINNIVLNNDEQTNLQNVQQIINSGRWDLDFDENCCVSKCMWSPAFRHLVGYNDTEELEDFIESFLKIIHKDDKDQFMSEFWNVVKSQDESKNFDFTFRMFTKTRGWRWFRSTGKVIRQNGIPVHFIGAIVDVDDKTKKLKDLSTIAEIYLTMHSINLEDNTVEELNTTDDVKKFVNKHNNAIEQMRLAMKSIPIDEYINSTLEFTDLTTIADRMKNKKIISYEFISRFDGWVRASFITADTDSEGKPISLIFATQIIENEKKKEAMLISTANTDELTKVLNRHAYEEELKKYNNVPLPEDLICVSLDLNGLKTANDNIGHDAGDELLIGAAKCMKDSFAQYGKIFRTGGDEFIVFVNAEEEAFKNIIEDFESEMNNWNGKIIKKLSIAYGYASAKEKSDYKIIDLLKAADKKMYQDKSDFYKQSGLDRRIK